MALARMVLCSECRARIRDDAWQEWFCIGAVDPQRHQAEHLASDELGNAWSVLCPECVVTIKTRQLEELKADLRRVHCVTIGRLIEYSNLVEDLIEHLRRFDIDSIEPIRDGNVPGG